MPRFLRSEMPVVVAAIHICDRGFHELVNLEPVEAHHVHSVHLAAALWRVSNSKRPDPAVFAEEMTILASVEEILRELRLSAQEPERVRPDDHRPETVHRADGTVAFERATGEID